MQLLSLNRRKEQLLADTLGHQRMGQVKTVQLNLRTKSTKCSTGSTPAWTVPHLIIGQAVHYVMSVCRVTHDNVISAGSGGETNRQTGRHGNDGHVRRDN